MMCQTASGPWPPVGACPGGCAKCRRTFPPSLPASPAAPGCPPGPRTRGSSRSTPVDPCRRTRGASSAPAALRRYAPPDGSPDRLRGVSVVLGRGVCAQFLHAVVSRQQIGQLVAVAVSSTGMQGWRARRGVRPTEPFRLVVLTVSWTACVTAKLLRTGSGRDHPCCQELRVVLPDRAAPRSGGVHDTHADDGSRWPQPSPGLSDRQCPSSRRSARSLPLQIVFRPACPAGRGREGHRGASAVPGRGSSQPSASAVIKVRRPFP